MDEDKFTDKVSTENLHIFKTHPNIIFRIG